ncbi:MAG: hypothetical protein GY940_22500 [bacterium]|nr:hypothetical protein [bacterium]
MILYFQLLAVLGFLVSVYSLYVRHKVIHSDSYSPICDISDRVSCSKAFGSRYSKTMGIPNALAGNGRGYGRFSHAQSAGAVQ